VHRRSIPTAERLSETELVADLTASGVGARFILTVDGIVSAVVEEARPGDQIIVMSNGGFEGIHDKLLEGLRGR
jgi:UDP-N-acetylmuramate: L-alanyl-gamma-D-glutamyl-meso-diaminopimelate ligase